MKLKLFEEYSNGYYKEISGDDGEFDHIYKIH